MVPPGPNLGRPPVYKCGAHRVIIVPNVQCAGRYWELCGNGDNAKSVLQTKASVIVETLTGAIPVGADAKAGPVSLPERLPGQSSMECQRHSCESARPDANEAQADLPPHGPGLHPG